MYMARKYCNKMEKFWRPRLPLTGKEGEEEEEEVGNAVPFEQPEHGALNE